MRPFLALLILGLSLIHCSESNDSQYSIGNSEDTSEEKNISPTSNPYYKEYDDPVYITGKAVFEHPKFSKEGFNYNKVDGTLPIRKAFVLVRKGSKIIQGVNTDLSGEFKIPLPKGDDELSVYVRAEAESPYMARLFIVKDVGPSTSSTTYHFIKETIIADKDKEIDMLKAKIDENAGAFYILDQLIKGADRMEKDAGEHFKKLPSLSVYWTLGSDGLYKSNIGSAFYFGYFLRTEKNVIRIRGGEVDDGEVEAGSDPDHFDASVILHEYGHYLENNLGKTSSPGGIHSLVRQDIDPRLAWSEGWSHFIQRVVTGKQRYSESLSEGGFYVDLEKDSFSSLSAEAREGTGEFRELQIARYLNDLWDGDNDEEVQISDSKLWSIFFSSKGFKKQKTAFVSLGLFNYFLNERDSSSDLTDLIESYKMPEGRENFAQLIGEEDEGCRDFKIEPKQSYACFKGATIKYECPDDFDWLDSNDYFHYIHSGASKVKLRINYEKTESASKDYKVHFNIYYLQEEDDHKGLWDQSESEGDGAQSVEFKTLKEDYFTSIELDFDEDEGDAEQELKGLGEGLYLFNVRTSSQNPSFKYKIFIGENSGVQLCPKSY